MIMPTIYPARDISFEKTHALLKSVVSSTLIRMPAINTAPELFDIEAASPEVLEPENESYVVHMRLQGTYEVRSFLSDVGIDERKIAMAVEELSRRRRVTVSNP